MRNNNPFSVGDKVTFLKDITNSPFHVTVGNTPSTPIKEFPKYGDELTVSGVHRGLLRFDELNTGDSIYWWPHHAFVSSDSIQEAISDLL